MKKVKLVFTSDLSDDKLKQKALKTIVGPLGVDSVAMDKKAKKLTVTGDIDPVHLVMKMRKVCFIAIVSVGPAEEPHEKKEEPREEEPKEREGDDVSEFVKVYPAYKERPQSSCYLLIYFI